MLSKAFPALITKMDTPNIDGRVNDSNWEGTYTIPALFNNMEGEEISVNTSVCVGYDDTSIYFGIRCAEPHMKDVTDITYDYKNAPIYNNDSIELFLDPKADGERCYHFIADIVGQKYEAIGGNCHIYYPEWQVVTHRGEDFWSAEIAIPFSALGVSVPAPGDTWLVNIARGRYTGEKSELYALNPSNGSLDSKSSLTHIAFESLGRYMANAGSDLDTEALSWPISVRQEAENWLANVLDWKKEVEQLATIDKDDYASLHSRYLQLQKECDIYRKKVLRELAGGSSLYVTKSLPYEPFFGNVPENASMLRSIRLTLLRDEWMDVAVNITNTSDTYLTVRASTRHGRKKEFYKLGIPGIETTWSEALPVGAGNGNPAWDAIQPLPAGVIEIPSGDTKQVWLSLHLPKDYLGDTVVRGFMNIEVVNGTPSPEIRIPLKINVLEQILTQEPPVHVFTWNTLTLTQPSENKKWLEAHFDDLRYHGVDTCMIHNWTLGPRPKAAPDGTIGEMDFSKVDQLIEATRDIFPLYILTIDVGVRDTMRQDLFGLKFPKPNYEKAFKSWIRGMVDHLKQQGIGYDRLIVIPYDEFMNDNCYTVSKWIKEADPHIRNILDSIGTVEAISRFGEYIDIWMPHFDVYQADEHKAGIELMRKHGKDTWLFWYSKGGNEKHRHPAQYYMHKFWWAFRNDVTGVAYWAQQYYGDPWNRAVAGQRYDTALVYPTETGCIPSRRWQAWRQGWQDYCLLYLACGVLGDEENQSELAKLKSLIGRAVRCPENPANFEKARDYAKSALMKYP